MEFDSPPPTLGILLFCVSPIPKHAKHAPIMSYGLKKHIAFQNVSGAIVLLRVSKDDVCSPPLPCLPIAPSSRLQLDDSTVSATVRSGDGGVVSVWYLLSLSMDGCDDG